MRIVADIAYPDTDEPELTVVGVQVTSGRVLRARFSNGEEREIDITPFLSFPAFRPLADEATFRAVGLLYGAPSWCDDTIDLAPSYIYEHGRVLTAT